MTEMKRETKMIGSETLDFGPRLCAVVSPDCSLSDLSAFLDSYGVELCKNEKCLVRMPVGYVLKVMSEITTLTRINPEQLAALLFPTIDQSLCLRLIQWEPFDEGRAYGTRWPFWVDQPLKIHLSYGTQWWQFTFSPGKTYEEREIDNKEAVTDAKSII